MKVAFVTPWYGQDIPGGAELACRKTAEALQAGTLEVEVLTTCVKDFYADWGTDFYRQGSYRENGVTVRRFRARKRNKRLFDSINVKLMNHLPMADLEQQQFVEEIVRSDDLCDFIVSNRDDYRFMFIPYMFGTTHWALPLCAERSVLIPCLHDEPYAYLKPYRRTIEAASRLVFHSKPELDLALRLYNLNADRCHLVGIGVDTTQIGDAQGFRGKYGIEDEFVLYAGRREPGKNTPLLLEYFARFRRRHHRNVKLVLIGSGAIEIPQEGSTHVLDLGFVPNEDKLGAYAAASVVCQPSLHESFSLSIMEAWVQGTPVLVHSGCEVTRSHCIESNGGLFFQNYAEFDECLNMLLSESATAGVMGTNGRDYVLSNFSWATIVRKYHDILRRLE